MTSRIAPRLGMAALLMTALSVSTASAADVSAQDQAFVVVALQRKAGAPFDRAYIEDQVAEHQTWETLLGNELTYGSNPELKAFGAGELTTVRQHLRIAERLAAKG